MNNYRIMRVKHGFRAIEVSKDGGQVTRHFQTEAIAQIWVVQRATVTNLADLAQWLLGTNEGTP
jgi:hypothetical protein